MPMNDLIIHKEHALSWIDKKYSALKKWLKPLSSNFPDGLQSKGKRKAEKSLAAKCTKKMAEALKFQFP